MEVRLRPRGPDGGLGDEVTVYASISSLTASLIRRRGRPLARRPRGSQTTPRGERLRGGTGRLRRAVAWRGSSLRERIQGMPDSLLG